MALTGGGQFLLLLWKNAKLQSRKKILTVLQIIMPTLGALIFLGIRFAVSVTRYESGRTWPSFDVEGMQQNYSNTVKLAYAPNVTVVQNIITRMETELGIQGVSYADGAALLAGFVDPTFDKTMWGGLVFTNSFPDPTAIPSDIRYSLRPRSEEYAESFGSSTPWDWFTELMYPEFQQPGPRAAYDDKGGPPEYANTEFLTFMRSVDKALAMEVASAGESPDRVSVELQRFPYPPYVEDGFVSVLETQLPLLIVLGFLFTVPDLTSSITLEKEKRLKEYMKIMGLSNWLHWTAWFLKAFIMLLISVILMTILFLVQTSESAVLNAADGGVVFVFLLLYAVSCICYSFMFSTFFKKASSAAGAAGLLFYLTYIPATVTEIGKLNLPVILVSCLLNNVAMAMGCRQIALYEGTGAGQKWSNLNLPVSEDEVLTMGHIYMMLIIDSIIYLLITWYVENVFPGAYGIPRRFYFPCTREYWCGPPETLYNEEEGPDTANLDPEFFEPPPANIPAGISIKGLRKEFKRGKQAKIAVAGTTLDMLEGQVTALLGHNGAGKTTTMSMLTGFLPPTGGTAVMNGFDIRTQMKHVRSSLGLCPQHDVLFDTLTVHEHLTFYARLKGCPGKQVEAEVTDMIRVLGLEDKTKELSKGLSGGMKRKLSMGIALIHGSKIVVLDEPTSGMDPEARRKAWDILQSQREGRTVLLSTHFMDEADLLGDRIAIMAEGVVKCCGSSLFLKNKYGVGYHLVMVKETFCDVDAVTNFIVQYVPDAKLESNVSAELSYTLPSESSDRFEEMFTCLEKDSASLGIQSFGASVTTMEEVFMRVGESCHDEIADGVTPGTERNGKDYVGFTNMAYAAENGEPTQSGERNGKAFTDGHGAVQADYSPVEKHRGIGLLFQQFKGMFIKGMIMTWRNRAIAATQILMPVIFTILGVVATQGGGVGQDPAPRILSVGNSQSQTVAYALNDSMSNTAVDALKTALQTALQGEISEFKDVTSEGLEQNLLSLGESSMDTYSRNYLVAAQLTGAAPLADGNETVVATGLFNAQTYHAIGMALAAIDEAILNYVSTNSYTLEVTNHPLPRPTEAQLEQDSLESLTQGFILSIDIIFGVSFMVATFVIFIVTEDLTKAKHVQFVSGVQTGTYWLSLYSWHVVNYLIPAILIMVVLLIFGLDEFKGAAGGYTFLLLIFYGMAILPCTYLMSFMFKKPSTAYTWTSIINVFLGTGSIVAVFVLSIPALDLTNIADMLRWVFYILIPNFSMGIGIQDIYANYNNKKICTATDLSVPLDVFCAFAQNANISAPCCPDICARDGGYCASWTDNIAAWEYPGIGRSLLFLFIQIIVFFAFIFFFESGTFKSLGQRILEGTNAPGGQNGAVDTSLSLDTRPLMGEDADVAEERKNILNTPTFQLEQQNTLILKELRKFYGGFLAVDRLSLGIPSGECFGLLGVNGAGKTTTFKMLTGDVPISSGDALLDGHSVKRDIKEVQRRLGYCPQFDALLDQLTVEETLYMYARLRGIKNNDIPGEVNQVITSLLLQDHAKKRCSELSGGNKRKLSTAIAILGDPPVVFLDEPTTGMDPVARRSLWDTLTAVRQQGRTLVLTSHSMEECEALCTRLAIMVNGQFKCLGSVQHLKANCGEGYTLLAKVGGIYEAEIENNTQRLSAFVQEQFPGSELKDLHQGYIHYQVKSAGVSWARIFGTLERAKGQFCIQDYSVSQTTLEQVFINFARAQVPPREKGLTASQKIRNCLCFCCGCGCCKDPHANQ